MSLKLSRVSLLSLVIATGGVVVTLGLGCELIVAVDRDLIAAAGGSATGTGGGAQTSTGSMTGTGGAGGMTGTGGNSGFPYPTDLTAVINGPTVDLTWIQPDPASGNTEVKLVRTLNTPPTGPTDAAATVIYTGSLQARSHALSQLLPDMAGSPHTYHYAVYGCTPAMDCEMMGSAASLTPTLRQCLMGGGYNIIWRHATADVCSDNLSLGYASMTTYPDWWKRCDTNCPPMGTVTATARQLNATGVAESQSIGQSFKAIGIPVGRVLSSEYCRCIQTVQYMDFGPMIEERSELTYYAYDDVHDRCTVTQALLAQDPPPNQNVALVSHAGFSCPTLDALLWSEAAIYKPDGSGGKILIATKITWNAWDTLP